MENVNSIILRNVQNEERHTLNEPEFVIGRGWLNCDDKRISRKHGLIKITSKSSLSIISTHTNPIFIKRKGEDKLQIVEKGGDIQLQFGDSFGLLPDLFWFDICQLSKDQMQNMENPKTSATADKKTNDDATEQETANHDTQPNNEESNGLKRKLPSWLISSNKKFKNEPGDPDNSLSTIETVSETHDDVNISTTTDNLNEVNVADDNDSIRNIDTMTCNNIDDSTQSLNAMPILPYENEELPANNASDIVSDVVAPSSPKPKQPENDETTTSTSASLNQVIKTEPIDANDGNEEQNNLPGPSNISIKQEIKTEIKDEPNDHSDHERDADKKKAASGANKRECCRFGIRCYRRNPMHRAEEAHPGDLDYRLPDYGEPPQGVPPCPYGDRCFRRNPVHFQQFSHPPSTDAKQNRKLRKKQQKDAKVSSTMDGSTKTSRKGRAIDYTYKPNYGLDDDDERDSEEDPFAVDNSEDDPDFDDDLDTSSESNEDTETEVNTEDINTQ